MKKLILLMTLLILVVGCSDKETEERIAMLENRITELEIDILCQRIVDEGYGGMIAGVTTQTQDRFLIGKEDRRDSRQYCRERQKYFEVLNNTGNYTSKYAENLPDSFFIKGGQTKFVFVNNKGRNRYFDPIYKDWYQEKE